MHVPVMLTEVELFCLNNIKANDVIVDCTYGYGGHNKVFQKYTTNIISIDRDQTVCDANPGKVLHDVFGNIDKYTDKATLIFADLGLSNMQIFSERGFSFTTDSILDMRMGCNNNNKSAYDVINSYNYGQLVKMFNKYDCSTGIVNKIVRGRLVKPIKTTQELIKILDINDYKSLAKIFQAIRIEVNSELDQLEILLEKSKSIASKLGIITFHSLEENMVKKYIRNNNFITSIQKPSQEEITRNPQSRSATLFLIDLLNVKK